MHAQKGTLRLQLHRSAQHIYASILDGGKVLATANTLSLKPSGTKTEKAVEVGKALGIKAKELGVTKVACDRSGFSNFLRNIRGNQNPQKWNISNYY